MVLPSEPPLSMVYPTIKRLYKYSAFNSRSISALVMGKLWYALPTSFNDPFDCTLPKNALIGYEQLTNRHAANAKSGAEDELSGDIGERIRAFHQNVISRVSSQELAMAGDLVEFQNEFQSFLYNCGILSLSATPRSILMWAHYGAQHSGICFEFNRSPTDKLGTDAKRVIYSNQRDAEWH